MLFHWVSLFLRFMFWQFEHFCSGILKEIELLVSYIYYYYTDISKWGRNIQEIIHVINDLFGLLPPKNFKKYLASNLTTLSISDKDYFRNASCALHLISIYVFIIFYHLKQCITTMDYHFRKSGWSRVLLRYL
jgi:hypothetical protein